MNIIYTSSNIVLVHQHGDLFIIYDHGKYLGRFVFVVPCNSCIIESLFGTFSIMIFISLTLKLIMQNKIMVLQSCKKSIYLYLDTLN